jgi:hypothetical protein
MLSKDAIAVDFLRCAVLIFIGLALCPNAAAQCVSLAIAVQTSGGGATVSGTAGVYSVPFGNVNGLGLGTPASGVSVSRSSSGATYTTPINVTTTLTGCVVVTTETIKVYQNGTTSSDSQSALREGSSAGSVISVPSSQASASTIATSALGNQTLTRYVGLFVNNNNGASRVTGSLAPKVIYEVTVN